MSKSDNPILDAIREIMQLDGGPVVKTPTAKTTVELITALEDAVTAMIKGSYKKQFDKSIASGTPTNFSPMKAMETGRNLVRDTVETKLNEIMVKFQTESDPNL